MPSFSSFISSYCADRGCEVNECRTRKDTSHTIPPSDFWGIVTNFVRKRFKHSVWLQMVVQCKHSVRLHMIVRHGHTTHTTKRGELRSDHTHYKTRCSYGQTTHTAKHGAVTVRPHTLQNTVQLRSDHTHCKIRYSHSQTTHTAKRGAVTVQCEWLRLMFCCVSIRHNAHIGFRVAEAGLTITKAVIFHSQILLCRHFVGH